MSKTFERRNLIRAVLKKQTILRESGLRVFANPLPARMVRSLSRDTLAVYSADLSSLGRRFKVEIPTED